MANLEEDAAFRITSKIKDTKNRKEANQVQAKARKDLRVKVSPTKSIGIKTGKAKSTITKINIITRTYNNPTLKTLNPRHS